MVYQSTLCDFQTTQSLAQYKCGMKLVSLAQIETLPGASEFDFYKASSSDAIALINKMAA